MRRVKQTLFLLILGVLFTLAACAPGQDTVSGSPGENAADNDSAETSVVTKPNTKSDMTKIIRLGSAPYFIRISREFSPMRISNEDWEDDMVACYHNDVALLDFAVYQFSKEGYPDTLAEFVEQEAEEYDASEVVTDETVNGIAAGYYRSMNTYGGVYRDGLTYVFESDGEYIELDFWLIGYQAEREMEKIIDSLTVSDSEILSFGAYQICVPRDFVLVSGPGGNPVVYRSGNASLYLYVSRFPADGTTLTDFVRASGGSDIETDAKINGISVASYRAVEAVDGAFRSTLTYVLDDGNGFTKLTFRLEGITAEEEAAAILKTLSKYL